MRERNVLSIGGNALGKFSEKFGKLPGNFFGGFFWTALESSRKYQRKIFGNFPWFVPFGSNWIALTHIASLCKYTVHSH